MVVVCVLPTVNPLLQSSGRKDVYGLVEYDWGTSSHGISDKENLDKAKHQKACTYR